MILPLASDGGCQLMLMVRGRPSLLTTVTSLGADVGTEETEICNAEASYRSGWSNKHKAFYFYSQTDVTDFIQMFIFSNSTESLSFIMK